MTPKRFNRIWSWTAALFVVGWSITATIMFAWYTDIEPVLTWDEARVISSHTVKPGGDVVIYYGVTKNKLCPGRWQTWLHGKNASLSLGPVQLSRLDAGESIKSMQLLTIPPWVPVGKYDIRLTAWYSCNPLQNIRQEMPPIPIIISE